MNDREQSEEWSGQNEENQTVWRQGTKTKARREGIREGVQKKSEREAGPTCESHYSDSSFNTTFLLE